MKKFLFLAVLFTTFASISVFAQSENGRFRHDRDTREFRHHHHWANHFEGRHLRRHEFRYRMARRHYGRNNFFAKRERRHMAMMRHDFYRNNHNRRRLS